MKTLAVLYICTGAYVAFWRDFYPNFKANFLPDCDRTFFCLLYTSPSPRDS